MNKHVFIRATYYMLIALALAACTQEELPGGSTGDKLPEGLYPLVISSVQMAEMTGAVTRVSENMDGSASQWDGNEVISVRIGDGEPGTYQVDSYGELTALSPAYWASTVDDQTIIAWYPTDVEIPLDQQGSGNRLAYVLKAETQADFNQSGIQLPFTHQLAKVRVKLEGSDFKGDLSNANLTMLGLPTSCTLNNGTLEKGNLIGDIPMRKATYNGQTYYEANVLPDIPLSDIYFRIQANGTKTTTAKLQSTNKLIAGKIHTINVTIDNEPPSIKPVNNAFTIGANENVQIKDYKGKDPITVTAPATVTLNNVSISAGCALKIEGNGTVDIIIKGKVSLTSSNFGDAGIFLSGDNTSVTITGLGTEEDQSHLITQGAQAGCGIGTKQISQTTSNITILNCKVEAYAGKDKDNNPAGIGARQGSSCGDITIKNSFVAAKGNGDAPPIGAQSGTCGTITYTNSTINGEYYEQYTE